MDAIEAIKQDHQRMEETFARLEAGDGDRRALLTEIENRLEAHSHAEEQEVYPAIKKAAPDEADEVEHGYDEHAEAESLLHKAQSLVDSPDFDDALQEFLEAVRHHINEEESEILPALADAVEPAELARLGEARGAAFDRLFLTYMIRHHEGALAMVAELLATPGAGQEPEAFRLASDVDADQRAEIARMRAMLGAAPNEAHGR